jgi:hypothetical protein
MMPHQIYCDLLEDRGVDTRLLRTQEPEGYIITTLPSRIDGYGSGYSSDTLGNGCGDNRGIVNGYGYNGYGDGDGYGCGDFNSQKTGNGIGGSNGLVEMQ